MLLHQSKVTAVCIVSPWSSLLCYFVLTHPTTLWEGHTPNTLTPGNKRTRP